MDGLQVVLEPRRREILRRIWVEEKSAGDIAAQFDVSFGAVSQHLAVLRGAGYVRVRQEGRRRLYTADRAGLGELAPVLEAMWGMKLDSLAAAVESRRPQRRGRR